MEITENLMTENLAGGIGRVPPPQHKYWLRRCEKAGLTYTWLQHKNADRTVLNLDGFSSTSMSGDTTTVTVIEPTRREESFMQFCLWCSMNSNDDVYRPKW